MIKTTNKTMYDLELENDDEIRLKKMQEFADNLSKELFKKYDNKNNKGDKDDKRS